MGAGSTLDPDNLPLGRPDERHPPGHDLRSLGPSDSSDSGSDLVGAPIAGLDGTGDRHGTGERPGIEPGVEAEPGTEILPDRVVAEAEAGLGDGLDQAEEARLGITDEELEALIRERLEEEDEA
ncbi:MAG: chemotaxis protein [Gammaproteobacteria bacterium]|nr:chemotaxis protein [Gammaproteobacteria bacterium]